MTGVPAGAVCPISKEMKATVTSELKAQDIEVKDLASRKRRLVGALIDVAFETPCILALVWLTVILEPITDIEPLSPHHDITYTIVGLIIFLILNGYLLSKRGQTMGKVIVRTRIVDLNGNVPRFGKLIFLRYVVVLAVSCFHPLFGIIILVDWFCIFGKGRRCLHDYLAGTRVIKLQDG